MHEFRCLVSLLRLPSSHPEVIQYLGGAPIKYQKDWGDAHAEMPNEGISIIFDELGGLYEDTITPDLRVSCVHLYPQGLDGYQQYKSHLPGGIVFGDTLQDIRQKLGSPMSIAELHPSEPVGTPPLWVKYPLPGAVMHLQLNGDSKINMISLMPDPPLSQKS